LQRGGTHGWPAANIHRQYFQRVMQVSSGDHHTAPITFGRAQAIQRNVVDAIAAATGAHGHRNYLLPTQPRHNTEVRVLPEDQCRVPAWEAG